MRCKKRDEINLRIGFCSFLYSERSSLASHEKQFRNCRQVRYFYSTRSSYRSSYISGYSGIAANPDSCIAFAAESLAEFLCRPLQCPCFANSDPPL